MAPENFWKINNKSIQIDGRNYRLEVDQDGADVWVFPEREAGYTYALYFEFDWDRKTYSIKKAILGDGRNFENVSNSQMNLFRGLYRTMNNFIEFVTASCEINENHFKY